VMNVFIKDSGTNQRRKDIRQQEIRDSLQPVASGRMARNLHSQATQLLHQPPNLRPARPDFLRDLGAADHHSGMIHQQPDNPAQANVAFLRSDTG